MQSKTKATKYKGYFASTDGSIVGPTGKKLKQRVANSGYAYISISLNGKSKNKPVHRIIAETFIPNPLNLEQVNHINGNKLDNRVENLEWVSRSKNMKHAARVLGKDYGFNSRKVLNLTTGEQYSTSGEAAESLNVCQGSLWESISRSGRCKGCYLVYDDEPKTANELIARIKSWGRSKNIKNPILQYAKVNEEVGEIAHEMTRGNLHTIGMADAIGDSAVTLIILADILGMDFTECMKFAYDSIKDRKGKTEHGTFIKDNQ